MILSEKTPLSILFPYINWLIPGQRRVSEKEKCFGKKSAYMIEKVVDEIVLAKARRESDGTYSA